MKRIIHQTTEGGVAIIIPSQEALDLYGIEAIALKDVPGPVIIHDVPTGTFEIDADSGERFEVMGPRVHTFAFKIVDAADIPSDRSFRSAWEVDAATLTDGVGSESNSFPEVA